MKSIQNTLALIRFFNKIHLFQAARRQIKRPAHGVPIEELPEPKIMMRDEVDQTAGYYHYGEDDRRHEFPTTQDIESYNGYAVQDHMKYDDEPLVSYKIFSCTCIYCS